MKVNHKLQTVKSTVDSAKLKDYLLHRKRDETILTEKQIRQ